MVFIFVKITNIFRWFGATNLEPLAARRVFPCFDEPSYKAKFHLTLEHHKKFKSISNTLPYKIEVGSTSDSKITSFKTTALMSTYNLAFIISDFSIMPNIGNYHSVYSMESVMEYVDLPMEIEDEIFDKLVQITSVPLEMEKMDLVAVPSHTADATVTWSLIFFE